MPALPDSHLHRDQFVRIEPVRAEIRGSSAQPQRSSAFFFRARPVSETLWPRRTPIMVLVRRGLVALTVIGILSTAFELAAERHWNGLEQLIPWLALAVLVVATALLLLPNERGTRAIRVLALIVLGASVYGIFDHILVNFHAGSSTSASPTPGTRCLCSRGAGTRSPRRSGRPRRSRPVSSARQLCSCSSARCATHVASGHPPRERRAVAPERACPHPTSAAWTVTWILRTITGTSTIQIGTRTHIRPAVTS